MAFQNDHHHNISDTESLPTISSYREMTLSPLSGADLKMEAQSKDILASPKSSPADPNDLEKGVPALKSSTRRPSWKKLLVLNVMGQCNVMLACIIVTFIRYHNSDETIDKLHWI
ncbi:hypothetical protein VTL71DRAFT_13919 [Oculimacula yallundae]|uniref:Uncharacterized protein n=1 Tax=Oculimacula yallundae TaxID=86028 RepID=A0ABR4CLQ1_9HELO